MITPHFLSSHWTLSQVSLGETFVSYPTRQVVRVHAAEGEYAAKIDSQPLSREEALRACAVLDFLSDRQFPHAPRLLKTTNGDPLHYAAQQSVTVMEFIGGGHPENTAETWRNLGQAARRLNAIADFPMPYGIPTREAIRELREDAANHMHKEQYLHFIELVLPVLEFPHQGLVHGEINLANALRRENGEAVIIDWDEAGTGRIVLDAGYPLLTTFLSEDLDFFPELAAAYYMGYYGQKCPGAGEIEMVFCDALLHALRYMRFWNQQKRWERICYAVAHKDELLSAVF